MTQLSERLQGALGDAFQLERELKPGGMSRLFLATERSLNRRVVIKLLPPDGGRSSRGLAGCRSGEQWLV